MRPITGVITPTRHSFDRLAEKLVVDIWEEVMSTEITRFSFMS